MREPLRADLFAPECPVSEMPIRIADKWGAMVIRCLEGGPRRFSELRIPMHRISAKVLTETLRALERDGLIMRYDHGGRPGHVEYELTPLGRSLLEPIAAAQRWAETHLDAVLRAREAYDTSFRQNEASRQHEARRD